MARDCSSDSGVSTGPPLLLLAGENNLGGGWGRGTMSYKE